VADDADEQDAFLPAPQRRTLPGVSIPCTSWSSITTCPRQYKYARHYGLLDQTENVVYRFHRYLRRGLRDLAEIHAEAPDAGWEVAEERLRARWATEGPAGHAYDAYYWRHAQAILRREWLTLTTAQPPRPAPGPAQQLHAELNRCIVKVTADRVATALPAGSNVPAGSVTVLVRLHTGRPYDEDQKDLALPLYYLAYRQRYPDAPVRVALTYVGDTLDDAGDDAGLDETVPTPFQAIDVTDEARKAVEKYQQPGRRQRSPLDRLDEAASGIEAGHFPPKPQAGRCANCAFRAICPADPEADA